MRPLHQRYTLYSHQNDTYIFVPDGEAQSLTVHRPSGDIGINPPGFKVPYSYQRSEKPIFGILGLISLSLSEYILVVTGKTLVGRLMGHDIYRATDFDILPIAPVSTYIPPHAVEAHLLALVRSHLSSGNFLFSYTWDLTRRLQSQWNKREAESRKFMWEVVDDRFFWNRFLQTKLTEVATADPSLPYGAFILPIMYGTFDIRPTFLNGRHMQLALISRRSRFRAGTRYFRRGIDHEGHVANFNETEQILLIEGPSSPGSVRVTEDNYINKLSFVQIRGSVPLFWSEINTLRYKPDLQIMDLHSTAKAMRTHLETQNREYGDQCLVNLVNQKGHEKPVKESYERYVKELDLPGVKYQYFDFHAECRKMRWDRISLLVDELKDDIDRYGYFQVKQGDDTPKLQKGIVRTNCMDNLDRTNVVQAALGKWTLNQQLRELGILGPNDGVDDNEVFSKEFREIWADHADNIAKAYGGSGALKSDFTRTNKRTRKGVLEDGLKSTMRYLKNNFFDGARQDGFDLMTGTWIPKKHPSSALFLVADGRPLITRSMPAIASFSMFMICAGLTLPRTSDYSLFYYFLLWVLLFVASMAFIYVHGIEYVSWPKLVPLTDTIYYTGPGYRSGHHGKGLNARVTPEWSTKTKLLSTIARRNKGGFEEIELGTKKRVD